MPETAHRLLTLTTQIAAAYVGAHPVDATAVPGLIRDIQRSLTELDPSGVVDPTKPRSPELRSSTPAAVEIRKSVFANHLLCLEDGHQVTMLKRHLMTAHKLTLDQYRTKWEPAGDLSNGCPELRQAPLPAGEGSRSRPRWTASEVTQFRRTEPACITVPNDFIGEYCFI